VFAGKGIQIPLCEQAQCEFPQHTPGNEASWQRKE
jgi:hypothetical protein